MLSNAVKVVRDQKPNPFPRLKGYKFRIYPNQQQKELISKTLGCCRKVYNTILGNQSAAFKNHQQSPLSTPKPDYPSGYSLCNMLPKLKEELPYLQEVSSVALQQTLMDLGTSFTNFMKHKSRYPRFKRYGTKSSFRLTGTGFSLKDNRFYMAKSKEPVSVKWSRELPSPPTSVTISKTPTGKYFISFICCDPVFRQTEYVTQTVGVDLGISTFATLSTGQRIGNPKNLSKYLKRIKRTQMHSSRKCKGSNNRKKCNLKVARLHERVANLRKDFIEKESTSLVRNHQFIGLETLMVANMLKNHNLAKSIQDTSWGMFVTRVTNKVAETSDSVIVLANSFYPSSKLCNVCGYKLPTLSLKTREWECPDCYTVHDRDLNAALNLENVIKSNLDNLVDKGKAGYKLISTGFDSSSVIH